jgi:2-polyprenyl-6-methoxyphenol hydroxylase-like FAD-dependent oxidoreductase
MTARVLATHFDAVTVLERDHIETQPALHKSIPQGNHLHVLLQGGQQVMASLYPGFIDTLEHLGGVRIRAGKDVVCYLPNGKAYTLSGSVREPRDLGFDTHAQSRGLLEYCVRQCTLERTNVQLQSNCVVQGLVCEDGRVYGVRYTQDGDSQTLAADFVVDAGGRGSRVPRWLTDLGFKPPEETTIGVDFAYSSAKFCKPTSYAEASLVLFYGPPPHQVRQGLLETIEDGLLHVSLAGRFGEYPPEDAAGFLEFANTLYTPVLYDIIKDAERVTDITHYRYPTSILRHYERLSAFPEGLLVLGDALCSFNPIYGQGMSSAALQVRALQQLLTERANAGHGLEGFALAFFPKAAEVIATPWTLAANQDFAYPQTTGERPPDLAERGQYFAALDALMAEDVEVQRLMSEVFNLAKPLSILNEEPLRSRVLARQLNK